MKKSIIKQILLIITLIALPCYGQDMRIEQIQAEKQKRQLLEKALQKLNDAEVEAALRHGKIVSDRTLLQHAIKEMTTKNQYLKTDIKKRKSCLMVLRKENTDLKEHFIKSDTEIKELKGFIQQSIEDANVLLKQSLHSALIPHRTSHIASFEQNKKIPSMGDLKKIADALFLEIQLSGEVKRTKGLIVDRKGREKKADLLILGNFTAMYHTQKESGFLLYSDVSERFFALSKLPSPMVQKKNKAYMNGKTEDVYLDISKGGALQKLAHELTLSDQINNGGPIVWPILIILLLSCVIVMERVLFILKIRMRTEPFMKHLSLLILKNEWDDCRDFTQQHHTKLIPRILLKAMAFKNNQREDMENVLQEAILCEIPKLERSLSTLGMLATIAPLLGLLGTVTGMINTFHVITAHGTNDPRLMSGGISEALVTTMLGLSVAIPIMLAHTLLVRRVENEIGQMEEKAVSFVNLVFKSKLPGRELAEYNAITP